MWGVLLVVFDVLNALIFHGEHGGERIASFLSHQRSGVISTRGSPGVWAMPVWYRLASRPSGGRNLKVDCLVPRWADVAHHLTAGCRVLLIVEATTGAGLRWVQVQGTAHPVEAPDWGRLLPRWLSTAEPHALYLVVRVTARRIDLVDEDLGYGVQETMEW